MPWSGWLASRSKSDSTKEEVSALIDNVIDTVPTTSSNYPSTLILCGITSITTLALASVYRRYLRRFPSVEYVKPSIFHRRSLYGYVTSVGDGDGFRLFHTPGGRLMGWSLLPWRRVQDLSTKQLKDQTLSVRIAGVDAPEMAHFGKTAQPYAQEALDWLKGCVLHRYVRVYPYRKDQYDRVVCMVYRRRWLFFRSDVGLQMLKQGLATVYEAKFGSEFGSKEQQYRDTEMRAKDRKIGMWSQPGIIGKMLGRKAAAVETPRQYKDRAKASGNEG